MDGLGSSFCGFSATVELLLAIVVGGLLGIMWRDNAITWIPYSSAYIASIIVKLSNSTHSRMSRCYPHMPSLWSLLTARG